MFVADQFTTFYFYDSNNKLESFKIDPSGLYFTGAVKVICSYLIMKQGDLILRIVKPVLKQYLDAEQGRTQGIAMNERKSKALKGASIYTKRVTAYIILAVAVACVYCDVWMVDESERLVNNIYFNQQQSDD